MEAIQAEIINIAVIAMTAFAGYITKQLVGFLKKKGLLAQVQNNKEIVNIVVKAVEQMYTHLHGEEKLNLAKMELVKLMQQKKINMSEKEIDLLIESMVKEMKIEAEKASK